MKKYLLVALLSALIAPRSLPAQSQLEDSLKAVMLLFDKSQKEAQAKISELTKANEELSARNLKLSRELEDADVRILELQTENLSLRGNLSDGAYQDYEMVALATPDDLENARSGNDIPIPDFTPNAFKEPKKSAGGADHLSDGAVLRVNLNKATDRELRMIPGVGPQMADRIIQRRPYASIWDLMKLQGMGRKRIETIQPYITLE